MNQKIVDISMENETLKEDNKSLKDTPWLFEKQSKLKH